jgi:hypothetical protein
MSDASNAIILTSGLTGSSVLTGLIARAGYWTGETYKKEYDTYENKQLIAVNVNLMQQAGYNGNYLVEFSESAIKDVEALQGRIDDRPFREFLEECERHPLWVWKDPRLWLTIRYWLPLLDTRRCRFIVLTRGIVQCWTSSILRRQIRSYRDSKHYEESVKASLVEALRERELPYLHLRYEDLITRPEESIAKINAHLGTQLKVEDLERVYTKP